MNKASPVAERVGAAVNETIGMSTEISPWKKIVVCDSARLVRSFFFFAVILGVGIKISPIPVLDLCALLLFAFFSPTRRGAAFSGWGIPLVAYGLLIFGAGILFAGDAKSALNSARQFVLIASLTFLPVAINRHDAASFIKGGFLLLTLSISLPLYGDFYQCDVAWWQDWLSLARLTLVSV